MITPVVLATYEGAQEKFQCKVVSGNPKPTVTWTRIDGPMPLLVNDMPGALHMVAITTQHTGRYKCTANNSVGTSEAIATLAVGLY